jgi:hypothetical protein
MHLTHVRTANSSKCSIAIHGASIDVELSDQQSTLIHNGRDVLLRTEGCQIYSTFLPTQDCRLKTQLQVQGDE